MLNYIIADYKRVISRIPRIIFLVIFEAIFAFFIIHKWNHTGGNYNSVTIVKHSELFFQLWFFFICLVDFVQSFNFDFSAKTIQVALGIGISRLQVILTKLIQTLLVIITDMLITFGVFAILCAVTGCVLTGQQIMYLVCWAMGTVLTAALSVSLVMSLTFRTQNMLMSMVAYGILLADLPSMALRRLTRMGPVFLARLELDRYTHGRCSDIIVTNANTGNFQLWPYIGVVVWFAIGIYASWLFFRKMELEF